MGLDCKLGLVRECNPQNYFDGALDDVGFFAGCPTASASASHSRPYPWLQPRVAGVLNDTEVLERWDQPLTVRVAAGLEPNLVLFYNFDHPELADVPNLGTAGSGYDLLLGRVADTSAQSDEKYYDTVLKSVQRFEKPKFVPAWALPRASIDPGAPVVASAAAGATITIDVPGLASAVQYTAPPAPWVGTSDFLASNGRTVHVVPRNKPAGAAPAHLRRVSGAEDGLAVLQASGANDLGLCMHAVVTALPTHGQLFVIANGYDAQSQVLLNTIDPDAITQADGALAY